MMWMEFECETVLTAETHQYFCIFSMWSSPGLLNRETEHKLFFGFFEPGLGWLAQPFWLWGERAPCLLSRNGKRQVPPPRIRPAAGETPAGPTGSPQRVPPLADKDACATPEWTAGSPIPANPDYRCRITVSARDTDRFERATLRRSVSDEGGEFHLARYQTLCFKLSFEHQCSRVASDVADWKFNSARERDGVLIPLSPLCLRSLGRLPKARFWIQQQESAFSGALSVKTQGAVVVIREGDLHVPSANDVRRLCLGQADGACLEDQH